MVLFDNINLFVFSSCLSIAFLTFRRGKQLHSPVDTIKEQYVNRLIRKYIIVLSVISSIAIFMNWVILIRMFGSIRGVLGNANLIYTMRVDGESFRAIPYLNTLLFSASALAGIYFERTKKIGLVLLLPLLLAVLDSLTSMGRVYIICAVMLYINPIIISYGIKHKSNLSISRVKVFTVIILSITILLASTSIRLIRGGNIRKAEHKSKFLTMIGPYGEAVLTSGVDYLAGPVATFSACLDYDRVTLGKGPLPGMQTISPFFRVLSKLNLVPEISYYETFINVGDRFMNTGTYLKDIFIDFGFLGIIIIPFSSVGLLCLAGKN
ncbi:oligosaccharide repeat unit polymerase [Candidatus Electrothrix aarhusensis]|uniref:Oligosaccharide repeat unit polymerase n=1 Tax=Candidatus Electrothrix aarhusensis TaxID=1859131 RepID=A0A3S3U9A4_9BACT|nr:oligosaccharide repeat unit polymerase [Candidatus Electrothrix aarhusensis]